MIRITNYDRYLFMTLRYGYRDMSSDDALPLERPDVYYFADIARRYECMMPVPDNVEQKIDAFLCYLCAYTPVNMLSEELCKLGMYAVSVNYRLEIGVRLTFERLNSMQLVAKDYLSRYVYRTLSFVDFMNSKDLHYVAICKNYVACEEIYEFLVKPEVAGCIYVIQHYARSGALFFPKMLCYFAETSQLVLDTDLLIDEITMSQDEISSLEVMRKVTLLFTVLRRDPSIVTDVWRRLCTDTELEESIGSITESAKAFMDDCGIVETRW